MMINSKAFAIPILLTVAILADVISSRAEVISYAHNSCIILFRISCNSSVLCSNFHVLFSKLFSRSLSKQSRSSQNDAIAKHDYSNNNTTH